jgi:hypothetical protein
MPAFVVLAVVTAGAAARAVVASEQNGCCGKALSGSICDLGTEFVGCTVGQGGNAYCYQQDPERPHCCLSGACADN